jgi:hypothetical protein
MEDLNIFMKKPDWNAIVECCSRIFGSGGLDTSDELGRRHVWRVFGVELIAFDNPGLEDDCGIPFSTFSAQVDVVLCENDPVAESEAFRDALAKLLALRLRSALDPETRLVRNLQKEVKF